MLLTIEIAAVGAAALLLLVCGVLTVEIAAALSWRKGAGAGTASGRRGRLAVLIPAHDEAAGIGPVLSAIRAQLATDDILLVVADNCSDTTAAVARAHGAQVAERHDTARRGKGYALDFGIACLRQDPPDVVVVVDADCIVEADALARLAATVQATGMPAQAAYLMQLGPGAPLQQRVSAFAFRVKNLVRLLGLKRLGLPCTLVGTGMAFPWPAIDGARLATGNIVEDMQLGIDLAMDGYPAVFEPAALVTSRFPEGRDGQGTQRRRWEHGHIATIRAEAPRLLRQALRQRRGDLLGMALDLLVPPLSLLVLCGLAILIVAAALWGWGAGAAAFVLSALAMAVTSAALVLAWCRFARDLLSPSDVVAIPVYVFGKVPMYLGAAFNRERRWVRSARQRHDGGS
jgi:cellulose synthase/poly-beta-1,6-N-acetylglucosamine synthase-like glycosyltransferase